MENQRQSNEKRGGDKENRKEKGDSSLKWKKLHALQTSFDPLINNIWLQNRKEKIQNYNGTSKC